MKQFLKDRKVYISNKLDVLDSRSTILYEDEMQKVGLRAQLIVINELLELEASRTDTAKTYRVELVDFIEASCEHEAIDTFIGEIANFESSDESFDVYEVDPATRKSVK